MASQVDFHTLLRHFGQAVFDKLSQPITGDKEDQLRAPLEYLLYQFGLSTGVSIICIGEAASKDIHAGKPDYAVSVNKLLTGFIELKAPGTGANTSLYRGHNQRQWKHFKSNPNIIYSDGNEWALYRTGQRIDFVRLSGDVSREGAKAVRSEDAEKLLLLLKNYIIWNPIIPTSGKELAKVVAPLCRLLKYDVSEAMSINGSNFPELLNDWRNLLFPDVETDEFFDAYAQTITFALLLANSLGATPLTVDRAVSALKSEFSLLSRALQILLDENIQNQISTSIGCLLRILGTIDPIRINESQDRWLYFYEDFLNEYDKKLRMEAGVYYTPVEVVHAQVRLVDDILTNRFNMRLGFASNEIVTLDPALGTGTYLIGIIEHALNRISNEEGAGAIPARGKSLAKRIVGFENLVGPYAVAELRVSQAFEDRGVNLPKNGVSIFLTDTLESPHTTPTQLPLYLKPITEQHEKALEIKNSIPVIVCIGNPPYDRHSASTSFTRSGGWVRWGDDLQAGILNDFINPVIKAGCGKDVKNLYNLYVYFWRWALWKVFEQTDKDRPGIVCFVTAASYLDGNAFLGMREHMRKMCDEVWIIDLGGQGRGTRTSDNVFNTLTPVAISIAVRIKKGVKTKPADVYYTSILGNRLEKLQKLDNISSLQDLCWEQCSGDWTAPFRPRVESAYFDWPLIGDILPWHRSGVKVGRTWPIAPQEQVLHRRWRELVKQTLETRIIRFKESPTGRKIYDNPEALPPNRQRLISINSILEDTPTPQIIRYAYRSFDRQYIIADARLIDRPARELWEAHSEDQIYLTTLSKHPLGEGPALTASADIPDLDHFRGSYAGEVFPLYRDSNAKVPNINRYLHIMLCQHFKKNIMEEDIFAYVYGLLSSPNFTYAFSQELSSSELRIPLTKEYNSFSKCVKIGRKLLHLHTFWQRFKGEKFVAGTARCIHPASSLPRSFSFDEQSETLLIGDSRFQPVSKKIWEYSVSGLKILQSWLDYRIARRYGRKSSPLDDITLIEWDHNCNEELLQLLWVLEGTINLHSEQSKIHNDIISGPLFSLEELPPIPPTVNIEIPPGPLFPLMQH